MNLKEKQVEKKLSGHEKDLHYLFKDMNDIIKIIKSLEGSGVLIDGITETVKDEIKKQEGGFLGALLPPLVAQLVQPVTSSVVKVIRRRGVTRGGRGYWIEIFSSDPSFKQYRDYLLFQI